MKDKDEKRRKRVEVPDSWNDMTEEEQDKFLDEFIMSVFPPPDRED